MKRGLMCLYLATVCGMSHATVINTQLPGPIAAFQSGVNVVDFESISGKTPQTITSYTHNLPGNPGDPVGSPGVDPFIFDQLPGVQFSVGGMVGTNEPALWAVSEVSRSVGNTAKFIETMYDLQRKVSSVYAKTAQA